MSETERLEAEHGRLREALFGLLCQMECHYKDNAPERIEWGEDYFGLRMLAYQEAQATHSATGPGFSSEEV